MKKLLFFLIAIMFAMQAWSQETIQIGNGSTGTQEIPLNPYFRYTISQQIYLASEITANNGDNSPAGFAITQIGFPYYNATARTRTNVDIYLCNTTKTQFTGTNAASWEPAANLQLVYSGTINFSDANSSWTTVTLQTPFIWDGDCNILLCVNDKHGAYEGASSDLYFYTHSTSPNNTAIYARQDGSTPYNVSSFPTGTRLTSKNNIKFIFDAHPPCLPPIHPSSSNVFPTTATVSWAPHPASTAFEYEVQYKPSTQSSWTGANTVTVSSIYNTFENLSSLTPNTTYNWRVREICDASLLVEGTDFSIWTNGSNFTTPVLCPAPTTPMVSDVFQTTATVSWTPNVVSGIDWELDYKPSSQSSWTGANTVNITGIPDTFYNISGLSPNTTYNWRVRKICNAGGSVQNTDVSTFLTGTNFTTPPLCPTPITPVVSNVLPTTATVSWTPHLASAAFEWELDYKPSSQSSWTGALTITVQSILNTYYDLSNLDPNTTYNWRVRAICGGGQVSGTDLSTNLTGTNFTTPSACPAPTTALTSDLLPTSVTVSWTPNGIDAIGWEVQYKPNSQSSWTDPLTVIQTGIADTFYNVGGLAPNTTYNWRVRKICDIGDIVQDVDVSAWRNGSNFTTPPSCPAPTGVSIPLGTITTIDAVVEWNPTIGGLAQEYIIQWKPSSVSSWNDPAVESESTTNTSFSVINLTSATPYNVRVRAVCDIGVDSSAWATANFVSSCDIITDFPWNYGFEDAWQPATGVGNKPAPLCWTVIDKGGTYSTYIYDWHRNDQPNSTGGSTFAGTSHSGSYHAICYTDYGTSDHNDWLITPKMALTGGELLSFWAMRANDATTEPDEISIFISDANITLDATGMGQNDTLQGFHRIFQQILPVGNWAKYEVNLSQYSGNRYIAFVRQGTPNGYILRLDDVMIDTIPSCTPPISITVSNTTETTADINFSPGLSTDNAWRIYYKEVTATEWDFVDVSSSPAQLTLLNSGTTYQFYLKTNCGDDEFSEATITSSFTTSCTMITEFPWSEGFEGEWVPASGVGNKPAPACWTVIDKGVTSTTYNYNWHRNDQPNTSTGTFPGTSHSGSHHAICYTDYGTSAHNDWLITPQLPLTGGERVRFWAMRATETTTEPDEISIFISDADITLDATGMGQNDTLQGFHRIYHQNLPVGNWERYEVDLSLYSGNRYIAFVRQGTPEGYILRLDDVIVETIPSCIPPHSITVSNETQTSVDINFVQGFPSDNAWRLYYKTYAATAWDSLDVYSSPAQLTNLTAGTNYQFYFKTICGYELSEASYPTSTFTTPCNSFLTIPHIDGFESFATGALTAASCYTTGTTYTGGTLYPIVSTGNAATGTKSLYFYGYHTYYDYIATLPVDVSVNPINTLEVTFKIKSTSTYSGSDGVQVGVMTDPANYSTFVPVGGLQKSATTTAFEEKVVSLASYTGTGTYIAIRSVGPGSYYNNYNYLDDLIIDVIPSCPNPQNFVATYSSPTSALLNWIEPTNVVSRTLEYKKSTETTWTTDPSVTAPPYTVSSLEIENTYNFRLKFSCGGTDESDYKYSDVYIGHCIPIFTNTYTTYNVTSFVTTGASVTNLNDNTPCTGLNYYDRTSLPFVAEAGDVINFTVTYAGGTQGVAVWVDLNQNYIFESSERVFNTTSYMSSPQSGSITIPASTPDGSYRIRVQVDGNTSNPSNPCQNATGNVIDYRLVLGEEVTICAAPINVTATSVTATSASINWTDGGTENAWLVQCSTGGNTSTFATTTHPYTLNLQPNTAYTVCVKAVCSANVGDTSECSNTVTFTTPDVPCYTPTDLAHGTVTIHTVPISWSANGATAWKVSWKNTLPNGLSGSGDAQSTNYTVTELLANTPYEICVKAVCAGGIESDSTCIYVTTLEEIGIPSLTLNTLQLYPNPTTGELQIMNYQLREGDKIEIYNLLGQKQQFTIHNAQLPTIDVSHLSAGMYTLKIGGYVGKFVKK